METEILEMPSASIGINTIIENEVDLLAAKGLSITRTAYEKLDYIISEYSNILSGLGLPEYEIAFYMLTHKEEALRQSPVVRDVYLGHGQDVRQDYCEIGDPISSSRGIGNLDMRVVGWAHYHVDFDSFLSSHTDKPEFDKFLTDHRLFTKIEACQCNATYVYAFVTNSRKEPYAAINVEYPVFEEKHDIPEPDTITGNPNDNPIPATPKSQYSPNLEHNPGSPKQAPPIITSGDSARQEVNREYLQSGNKRNMIEDIPFNIIEDGHYQPGEDERMSIRQMLYDRIILPNGIRLGDYVSMIEAENTARREEEQTGELTLEERVGYLEHENNILRQRLDSLEAAVRSLVAT